MGSDFAPISAQNRCFCALFTVHSLFCYNNLSLMKQTIISIIGEITTSGLREAVKKLKSDATTKKFTKLCNNLIGHEVDNLDKASYEQTVQWHKEAMELKSLSETISKHGIQI